MKSMLNTLFLATLLQANVAAVTECPVADAWCEDAGLLPKDWLLVDTHIDVPYRISKAWIDATVATADGNFDYPRAIAGGLNIPFMSIYTPAASETAGTAWQLANQFIDNVEAMAGRAPDRFRLVHSTADAFQAWQAERIIGLALGMENGAPLGGKLENLQHFYDRGIRYITLAHSKSNHIADSSYDTQRPWGGLSPFGEQVVAEMNRLGIMIDVSHISDAAFADVIALSKTPVIASHSSARYFTPGWERNMSDDMIRVLAEHGGVIQINFGSSFISQRALDWRNAFVAVRDEFLKVNRFDKTSDAAVAFELEYRAQNPFPYATLGEVADHFDHVIELVGDDHVGIGSDFDGVGDSLPVGLKDVVAYPALIAEFERRGYSAMRIRKILGLNLLRVWQAVERHAAHPG